MAVAGVVNGRGDLNYGWRRPRARTVDRLRMHRWGNSRHVAATRDDVTRTTEKTMIEQLKETAKRCAISSFLMIGSSMILLSGIFGDVPSWAVTVSKIVLVIGTVVLFASVHEEGERGEGASSVRRERRGNTGVSPRR